MANEQTPAATTPLPLPTPAPAAPAPATPAASSPGITAELVETTPLGMSSEQMKKSNPDAVAILQNQGLQGERDRVSALTATFGDDPTFLATAVKDGLTVDQAKAKQFDAMKAATAALKTENETLKKQGVVGFAASDKPVHTTSPNEGEAFEAEATAYWNKNEKVRAEFGGIFTDFRADFRHNRGDYS